MKELTIEQKAQRYDEAIKKAQAKIEEAKVFDYDDEQTAHTIRLTTTDIFPELKESEDEKIRKEIYDYLKFLNDTNIKDYHPRGDYSIVDMLAWLEKQGERKPTDKVEPKFKVGDIITSIYNNSLKYLIKEVGIKNELGKLDYYVAQDISDLETKGSIHNMYISKVDSWGILIEQNHAWSEEDEKIVESISNIIDTNYAGFYWERVIRWLKSLKNRVQF